MKYFILSALLFSIDVFSAAESALCQKLKAQFQEGDIFFSEVDSYLYKQVEATQKHWATHVGVIIKDKKNQWRFAESTIPLSKTSNFCDYFDGDVKGKFALKRLKKHWNKQETEKLHIAINDRLMRFYDLGFNYNASTEFCSKFVYQVLRESKNIKLGYFQKFGSMLEGLQPQVLKFWQYWFWGNIPFERVTITPASQYSDPQLKTVVDNQDFTEF